MNNDVGKLLFKIKLEKAHTFRKIRQLFKTIAENDDETEKNTYLGDIAKLLYRHYLLDCMIKTLKSSEYSDSPFSEGFVEKILDKNYVDSVVDKVIGEVLDETEEISGEV